MLSCVQTTSNKLEKLLYLVGWFSWKWWVLVNTVFNFWVAQNSDRFLTSWGTVSVSKRLCYMELETRSRGNKQCTQHRLEQVTFLISLRPSSERTWYWCETQMIELSSYCPPPPPKKREAQVIQCGLAARVIRLRPGRLRNTRSILTKGKSCSPKRPNWLSVREIKPTRPPPNSTYYKNAWNYTSTPVRPFRKWCLTL